MRAVSIPGRALLSDFSQCLYANIGTGYDRFFQGISNSPFTAILPLYAAYSKQFTERS
jgi:hypothetical protein